MSSSLVRCIKNNRRAVVVLRKFAIVRDAVDILPASPPFPDRMRLVRAERIGIRANVVCPFLSTKRQNGLYISMNLFKSVVASAISSGVPNFPYTFGDRQDAEAGVWVLQHGQRRVRTS